MARTETEIIGLPQALHRHAIVTPDRQVVKGDPPEDNTIRRTGAQTRHGPSAATEVTSTPSGRR